MIQKRLPIASILLGLTLLLGLAGVAYGLWFNTLEIHGIVETGSISMEWTSCLCYDQGVDPLPGTEHLLIPSPLAINHLDVAQTTCTIDEHDPSILHLTINNAYPSYWNSCDVHFRNEGIMPVKISGYGVYPHNFTLASANGADDGEVWVRYWDGVGTRMEPCPDESCEQSGSIQFHVEQPAAPNSTYEFDVKICVAQWNQDVTGEQCMNTAE